MTSPLSSIKSWILLVAYLKQKERNELMRCKEIISGHVLSITDSQTFWFGLQSCIDKSDTY